VIGTVLRSVLISQSNRTMTSERHRQRSTVGMDPRNETLPDDHHSPATVWCMATAKEQWDSRVRYTSTRD
jgi:hypothetical protein